MVRDAAAGPGCQYDPEFHPSACRDRPGLLSVANAGLGTDSSQFFLTFAPTAWLDDKHSIFSEVVDGKKTLGALEKRGFASGKPIERLEIRRATIRVAPSVSAFRYPRFRYPTIFSTSSRRLAGFATKSSQPAARHFSRSPCMACAVSAMIGLQ